MFYKFVRENGTGNTECLHAVLLKEFEFNIDDAYWFALVECNERILSLDELLANYSENMNQEKLCSILLELRQEGLLYCNEDYSEIVTIINTDKIS